MRESSYPNELTVDKLRWRCDPKRFRFKTTQEVKPCQVLIGQEQALASLRLGLGVRETGYNIFVAGEGGCGRNTAVRELLKPFENEGSPPEDICYVNNFQDPERPRLLLFPAGRGCAFRSDMEELVELLRRNLPKLFDSQDYRDKRKAIVDRLKEAERERIKAFEKKVEEAGFSLVQAQLGPLPHPVLMPLVAGNAVELEQLENLVEVGKFKAEDLKKIREERGRLHAEMEALSRDLRKVERSIREEVSGLDREMAAPLIKEMVEEVRKDFTQEGVSEYLGQVAESVLSDLDRFREAGGTETSEAPEASLAPAVPSGGFAKYKVNVLIDNARTTGAPVVFETSPTYKNLFGSVERFRDPQGFEHADFTQIRAGSLLRANGGYLVLNAMDVLVENFVYHTLKRNLRNRVTEIQSQESLILGPVTTLKPEPIPLSVKVILIGTEPLYRLLLFRDEDFSKVFKVKAEFDTRIDRTEENLDNLVCFICKICEDEALLAFDRTGVAEVAEAAARIAGRASKLTTRFNQLADLIRESAYWARQAKAKVVSQTHVTHAMEQRVLRVNLVEKLVQERITDGTILMDLEGKRVGQANGLAVYDLGDHAFGIPARITATVAMGRAGVVSIEREVKMSGSTHDKGVLILGGYLRRKYAQTKPLTMTASIAFEQSYGGVDGDSASSTEVYAILSALSGLPIRQDLAVTGSVNQAGEIQPIGGVNQKIEGYFDVCRARGLTGTQGVIIPDRNVPDLMLRHDVIQAVQDGQFHVYAVRSIDEGIALLTGAPAGESSRDGVYPEGSVNHLANQRLEGLARSIREFNPTGVTE